MGLVSAAHVMEDLPFIVGAHTQAEVQHALNRASAAVESYCEREFARTLADTVFVNPYRNGSGQGRALLPNPPVTNVSTVMAQMNVGGSLSWVELQHYQWTEDGLLYDTNPFYGYFGVTGNAFWSGGPNGEWINPPAWPFLPKSLQVVYDHGYILPGETGDEAGSPLPQGVVDAVIGMASFYLDNPTGAIENRVGEITTRYAQPGSETFGPSGWLDEKLLGQYRLVRL